MSSPWSFIMRRFGDPSDASIVLPPVRDESGAGLLSVERRSTHQLDGIGQRDELLRVRMSEMAERLEDLKTLGDDFSQLLGPMEAISSELPYSKARVLELEALHGQEVELTQALRREVDSLSSRVSSLSSDLTASHGRAGRLDATMRDREAAIEELRLALREKLVAVDDYERQLQSESEQAQSLGFEVKALRSEMQAADQALLESDRRLAELAEHRNVAEGEVQRLQKMAEDLSAQLVGAGSRTSELEQSLEDNVATVAALEIQLASEQAAHQRTQAQAETEINAARTDRSNLTMKAESLAARHAATEQILNQVRVQLREKEDSLRIAERSIKESASERTTLERRFDGLKEDLFRRDGSIQEGARLRAELEDRAEMLTKALSAKDAALETANARGQHLSERVDALTQRYEKERQSLEATNRRLLEELQNERAERTLAQGALDIARESRLSLQRQNETLKRAARARQGEMTGGAEIASPAEAGASNVAFFPAGERKGDEAR